MTKNPFLEGILERGKLRSIGFIASRAVENFSTGNIDGSDDLEELLRRMYAVSKDNDELQRELHAHRILSLMMSNASEEYKGIAPIGDVIADIERARREPGYQPTKAIYFAQTLSHAAANALGGMQLASHSW